MGTEEHLPIPTRAAGHRAGAPRREGTLCPTYLCGSGQSSVPGLRPGPGGPQVPHGRRSRAWGGSGAAARVLLAPQRGRRGCESQGSPCPPPRPAGSPPRRTKGPAEARRRPASPGGEPAAPGLSPPLPLAATAGPAAGTAGWLPGGDGRGATAPAAPGEGAAQRGRRQPLPRR